MGAVCGRTVTESLYVLARHNFCTFILHFYCVCSTFPVRSQYIASAFLVHFQCIFSAFLVHFQRVLLHQQCIAMQKSCSRNVHLLSIYFAFTAFFLNCTYIIVTLKVYVITLIAFFSHHDAKIIALSKSTFDVL